MAEHENNSKKVDDHQRKFEKRTTDICTQSCIMHFGTKWSKMGRNGQKWLKMGKNEQKSRIF